MAIVDLILASAYRMVSVRTFTRTMVQVPISFGVKHDVKVQLGEKEDKLATDMLSSAEEGGRAAAEAVTSVSEKLKMGGYEGTAPGGALPSGWTTRHSASKLLSCWKLCAP